ncbi:MAG TPA: enoyl-CoA hydratase/isomerase family protein [Amycolatopsis sp.]|nr:enoyl-CoA hydratase/isomerase family protein [Amycolatopsis sp.]
MLDLEYRATAIVVRMRTAPNAALTAELLDSVAEAIAYIGPHRAIVLTGTGGIFAPDLDAADGPGRAAARARLPRVLSALRTHRLPVVAAVNGDATGAGYALADAADLRVMSAGTIQPSSWTGRRYSAPDALAVGLIDQRCAPAELIAQALRHVAAPRPDAVAS